MIWTCQNDLGFSLYAVLSVYYVVITSKKWMESKVRVSTDVSVLPSNTRDQVQ